MVIHVIAGEGRERRRLDAHAVQTVLGKPVARCLQRQMVDALCGKLSQRAMQGDRIGRRVSQGPLLAVHKGAEGPEGRCLMTRGPPDLAREVGHRGLAVGPGDAGHVRRLGAVVARSRDREPVPGIWVGHEARSACQARLGPVRCEHRDRAAGHGIGDEVDARGSRAGERRKQEAGLHVARVRGEPGDLHVVRRRPGN